MLTGAKRWIGLASIADVAVIWAQTDDGIRGLRGADRHPGFHRHPDRAEAVDAGVHPVRHHADDVRLPADAVLPNVVGLKGPFSCLNEARYGIIWGAMGAARDSYEVALDYAQQREQFDKPHRRRSSSPSASSSTWCWRSRRGCWSRCRPGG